MRYEKGVDISVVGEAIVNFDKKNVISIVAKKTGTV